MAFRPQVEASASFIIYLFKAILRLLNLAVYLFYYHLLIKVRFMTLFRYCETSAVIKARSFSRLALVLDLGRFLIKIVKE